MHMSKLSPSVKKVIVLSLIILLLLLVSCLAGQNAKKNVDDIPPAETVAPTEEATEARSPGEPVDAEWFDDAVFVGDSVTLKLSYYCDEHPEALGKAQFFCAGSLGYGSALWELDAEGAVHPFYKGQTRLSEDCAEATGAKKVFIMLGMNDVAIYGVDGTIANADELYNRILAKTPDVAFYIQSVTPILSGHEIGDLNNEMIRSFNEALEQYCDEHGYTYLDINSVMADETGYLREEYCGDPGAQGIHFTDAACKLWSDTLKESV